MDFTIVFVLIVFGAAAGALWYAVESRPYYIDRTSQPKVIDLTKRGRK